MTETVISDAIPGIQDEGLPNISDNSEDWGSAGLRMMLAQAVDSDSYVRSDSELTFTNHDGTNDTVDVTAGVAYLDLTGETVDVQSSFGGSSPPAYDLTLPTLPAIPVIVPSTVTGVSLQDSTLSNVWLAYDTDGTGPGSAGSVYIRSDDTGSVTAPSHPSVELGQANPDNASADSLLNRFGSPEFNSVTSGSVDTAESRTDPRTVTINVPTDESTISDALDVIRERRSPPGVRFEIFCETGHTISEPVVIDTEDLSHVTMRASDDTVPVSGSFPNSHVFEVSYGISPFYDMKIDAQGNGNMGIQVNPGIFNASGKTTTGLINAGENGINVVNGSIARCYANDYSNAGNSGAHVGRASIVTFGRDTGNGRPDFSGAGFNGIEVSRAAFVRAEDADLSNVGNVGLFADDGGVIYSRNCLIDGAGARAINAYNSGAVIAEDADISNSTSFGSVLAQNLGRVVLPNATITGSTEAGVIASDGGRVSVVDASVTGFPDNDLQANSGGIISADDCQTTNSGGSSPHESDVSHRGLDEENGIIFGNFESA